MKITRKKTKAGHTLCCEGELTIYTVAAAKKILLGNLDEVIDSIALDLGNVNKLDTAGLQLLLFVKHIMADCNKKLYVKNSNEEIDSIFKEFDLADQFMPEH
ncbi:MAG TPA: STAS domain-containing protein [Cellvibrionaceae bacterium]|nr:STAS domain-containing protein [Cellvibrionaceae bacterium]HMW46904.1 STAS domain-containing protein [Cellvibrionaceae bacterium]HMW70723.1 STAS domain-containing protein [Cellvibrionaceae bacterium]HMY38063.1 STAS domain-containing protein [Marinagarivorans sp.]HNG59432.1 STAS domain-containing protein [Cellvibrionaceae bacterium]